MDQPHDRLVKRTFENLDNARAELQAILPQEIIAALDFSTLELCSGSFVSNELAARHSDLLYRVQGAQGDCFVYVLFEHQSDVDGWMLLRLLEYMVRIWWREIETGAKRAQLSPIIPVVLHHGEHGWTSARSFGQLVAGGNLFAPYTPSFEFVLDDLAKVSDDELRARVMSSSVRLVLLALRDARNQEFLGRLQLWGQELRTLVTEQHGHESLMTFLLYVLEVGNVPETKLREQIAHFLGATGADAVMTTAQRLRDEGKAAGIVEGKAAGIVEGKAAGIVEGKAAGTVAGELKGRRHMLVSMLTLKFGKRFTPALVAKVEQADSAELESLATRVLSADGIDEVFPK